MVVYDTQIYPSSHLVSGGSAANDSDSDWDLSNESRIMEDSEPPSDSSESEDSDDDQKEIMVVSKSAVNAKKTAGGGLSWNDVSSDFIGFLAKVKLPI